MGGCCASSHQKPEDPVDVQQVLDIVKLPAEEPENNDVEPTTAGDILSDANLTLSSDEEQANHDGDLNTAVNEEDKVHSTHEPTASAKKNNLPSIYGNDVSARERTKMIQETFKAMDTEGDGTVAFPDFSRHVTENLGMSDDEAIEMFQGMGKTLTSRISLVEFDTYSREVMSKEAKAHFLEIAGQDRVIDHKDWLKHCTKIKMKKRDMKRIWDKMDDDKSGKVTYPEFDNYVTQELLKKDHDTWFLS